MKKIITIILFLMLMLLNFPVHAAGSVSLSASNSSVTVGDEFNVSVNLSGASVATLTVRVSVDTSKVDYVSGSSNSSFSGGRAIYTWTDPNGGDTPLTGGTIATFKFKSKAAGTASFSVTGDLYTPEELPVNPSFSGVNVSISEKPTLPPVEEQPSTPGQPPSTQMLPSTNGSRVTINIIRRG